MLERNINTTTVTLVIFYLKEVSRNSFAHLKFKHHELQLMISFKYLNYQNGVQFRQFYFPELKITGQREKLRLQSAVFIASQDVK